jgi:hypothetical protein
MLRAFAGIRVRISSLRIVLLVLLVAGWWLFHSHHAWLASSWASASTWGYIAAVMLAIYLIAIAIGIIHSKLKGGYDASLGAFALMIAGVFVLAVAGLLAVGFIFHIDGILYVLGPASFFPILFVMLGLAMEGSKKLGKIRAARERPIPVGELAARLSGNTHVIQRMIMQPYSYWRELRYYAPDGRMAMFKQVELQVSLCPETFTWCITDGKIVVEEGGNTHRYKLTERGDGDIVYYLENAENAVESARFQTIEIRNGEPTVTMPVTVQA